MNAPAETVALRLDPGLAFGTGTHPTTALCLEWLEALSANKDDARPPLEGALVLDYGCGSGILAIAALLLGAREAIAVDIDPQALIATRSNAEINAVAHRISSCAPDALPAVLEGRKVDILVANILAGPLEALLGNFAAALAPGGRLALSGILAGQETALAIAAKRWFRLEQPAMKEDWVRISGQRNKTS
jgi:ribosomal protein L11 methyltransferase